LKKKAEKASNFLCDRTFHREGERRSRESRGERERSLAAGAQRKKNGEREGEAQVAGNA
jgi:hypothetical protein